MADNSWSIAVKSLLAFFTAACRNCRRHKGSIEAQHTNKAVNFRAGGPRLIQMAGTMADRRTFPEFESHSLGHISKELRTHKSLQITKPSAHPYERFV